MHVCMYYFNVYEYFVYKCTTCVQCPQRPKESIRFPRTGVTGGGRC